MPETMTHAEHPAVMRHNQRLTYADLLEEAQEAVRAYPHTQAHLSEELGVTPGALSQALNTEGGRFAKLQMRIIEHLTEYRIEEEAMFRALRKEN